ncbi:AMP-binding protein [Amycolatopsis sp. YIM 10]|uniref:non-ribosomal peptide synthetase n=1 Tax=Amycolatopsis sp. YIM 10 TaxID=2653857 RepID=UPI0012908AE9|nr:AMP-binding protein [Amycolatopsis sp. YIM 10]QFU93303.1 Linear gramicidin synthase subunit B [Amycolatopsis sp. YIM 10]
MSEDNRGPAVTSVRQDEAWFADRLDPGSASAVRSRAYRVSGPLDVGLLGRAWQEVVRRHDVLRATITEAGGRPVQRIAAADQVAKSFVDMGVVPDAEDAEDELCADIIAEPMWLAEGPLARLTVAGTAPDEHVVVLVAHRAVADESSMVIMLDELSRCYTAALTGRSPSEALRAPLLQYGEFARWQREREGSAEHKRMLDWWRDELTPAPPALALPLHRDRPAGPSVDGGVVRFNWGAELAATLGQFAREQGVDPAAVLLTAFTCLLHRFGGADRIPVGLPVRSRPWSAFDRAVGPFDSQLVLTTGFGGRPSFREVLNRVRIQLRDAAAHGGPTEGQLAAAVNPPRDPRHSPFFDAGFVYREHESIVESDGLLRGVDVKDPALRLRGCTVRRERVDPQWSDVDFALLIDEVKPEISGGFRCRTSMIDARIARFVAVQLRTVVEAALAHPDLPVANLPLDTPVRIKTALVAADRIEATAPVTATVTELVRTHSGEALPGVSYAELLARADSIAAVLPPGPVAVRMASGAGQVAAVLGAFTAGAHVVCLAASDSGERARSVLADLKPVVLLVENAAADDKIVQWYKDELDGTVVDINAVEPAKPRPMAVATTDLAYVAYTSGSTGRPKGITQNHAALAQFTGWFATEFRLGEGARLAQWAAPGYDAALCETFAALISGATLHPVPERIRANPEKLTAWLAAEGITHFQTVPSFAREVLGVLERTGERLPALTHLLLAGEALPAELANGLRTALPSARLINLYGPTESILATWYEVSVKLHGVAPIGRPIPGRQVLVVDGEDRPCPAGVTGNLVLRSPYLTPGYLGDVTTNAFEPLRPRPELGVAGGTCYRTGDLGRFRHDGVLEFRGRADSQVKVLGMRMELGEVEAALAAHPSIADCAVIGVPGADGLVSQLLAYVVLAEPGDAPVAEWRRHLVRRFGKTLLPLTYQTVDALPRNVGGKIDRRRLPVPEPVVTPVEPNSPAQRAIAAIFAELTGATAVAADDTFFAVGGQSVQLPRLLHLIRARLGAELSLWDYFADPTPAGLSLLCTCETEEE